jgi:STE24 endopeptidase
MIQLNGLLAVFLLLFVFRLAFQLALDLLNISFLRRHRHAVPQAFQGVVDGEKFSKITSYTEDSTRFGIVARLFDKAVLLAILLTGVLPWLVDRINGWDAGFIGGGLIFFGVLAIFSHVLDIPFDLYRTFVIEQRHGFNTGTIGLWLSDWAKGMLISAILGGIVLVVLLVLVSYFEATWWILAWVIISIFELVILWLYPVLIAPLFNRFEPVADTALAQRIASLMERAGLVVKGVFQMDAGKRSKHTNAYFTGIGKSKRIVLFDTLLSSHPEQEILSVLAHEAGHWKRKHVIKQLLLMEAISFAGLFIISVMLDWELLYGTFGFEEKIRYVGLLLAPLVLSPLGYFLRPLGSALSRKYEKEADDVAVSLMGTPEPVRDTLIRLSADNLANLAPHPIYAWFHYSHPTPVERIERLEAMRNGDPRNVREQASGS